MDAHASPLPGSRPGMGGTTTGDRTGWGRYTLPMADSSVAGPRGPARGGQPPTPPGLLSRGEIAAAGIPTAETPAFRDWCRAHLDRRYWGLRSQDQVSAIGMLSEHAERFGRQITKTDEQRGAKILRGAAAAKESNAVLLRRLREKQARKMPALDGRSALPPQDREDARSFAKVEPGDTEGEERWDPAWGDPDQPLPPPRPQGMKHLPAPKKQR